VAVHAIIFAVGVAFTFQRCIVVQEIGASLIAAGIAGWVIFLYVFVSSRAAERMALIEAAGIREVFPHRSNPHPP
jgi:hypothetical protein